MNGLCFEGGEHSAGWLCATVLSLLFSVSNEQCWPLLLIAVAFKRGDVNEKLFGSMLVPDEISGINRRGLGLNIPTSTSNNLVDGSQRSMA